MRKYLLPEKGQFYKASASRTTFKLLQVTVLANTLTAPITLSRSNKRKTKRGLRKSRKNMMT